MPVQTRSQTPPRTPGSSPDANGSAADPDAALPRGKGKKRVGVDYDAEAQATIHALLEELDALKLAGLNLQRSETEAKACLYAAQKAFEASQKKCQELERRLIMQRNSADRDGVVYSDKVQLLVKCLGAKITEVVAENKALAEENKGLLEVIGRMGTSASPVLTEAEADAETARIDAQIDRVAGDPAAMTAWLTAELDALRV